MKADPGQIEQVIMNLAVNARDAMPHGGKLTIETANVTLDDNYARFHSPREARRLRHARHQRHRHGHGRGNPDSHLRAVLHHQGTAKGTGLGLSTVYGIVKQSEGYIWVYSESGKGTTFKIYLPRVDAAAMQLEAAAARRSRANSPGPGRETILLVEDEDNLRQLTRQSLETAGIHRNRRR